MRLLNKIFGNRDAPEAPAGEGPDDSSVNRETIELEPYVLSEEDDQQAAPEQSGGLTLTPPATDSLPQGQRGRHPGRAEGTGGHARAGRRRPTDTEPGTEERPHELTRRRIARPIVPALDAPPAPPPIPADVADAADDPEEIDVSDQLEDVNDEAARDDAPLDATRDLIVEDDEPSWEEEETTTSVALWRDAAGDQRSPSSPAGTPEPSVASAAPARPPRPPPPTRSAPEPGLDSAHTTAAGGGVISPDRAQPDTEWTRMAPDTNRPKQTLVEAGTKFRGTLKSSCPVVVNGTLDGEIDAPALSVASSGSIQGKIRAKTLRSSGTLAGHVEAGEVFVSGAVRSKTVIRAGRLELRLGASGNGRVEVRLTPCELEQSDASGAPETGGTPTATGDSEASGSTGWDLGDDDSPAASSVEPARARSKRMTPE